MIEAIISKSRSTIKKYKVIVTKGDRKKTIQFGAKGYEDYTIHKDPERKKRYITRHKKNENWKDPFTAGFWALHILWNKPTIRGSISDTRSKFHIKIKNQI